MKFLGQKLSEKEMLTIKGGEATCWCNQDRSTDFNMPSGDPGVVLAAAQAYCQTNYSTSVFQCTGLDVEWE